MCAYRSDRDNQEHAEIKKMLEHIVETLEDRFDEIQEEFEAIEDRLDDLYEEMELLESKVRKIKKLSTEPEEEEAEEEGFEDNDEDEYEDEDESMCQPCGQRRCR